MIPDLNSISAALSSIKTASEIVKGAVALRDRAKALESLTDVKEQIIAAYDAALDAKTAQAAMLEEIASLKAKIAEFDKWETEKERYELIEMPPGSYAYRVKETARGAQPTHLICATCFEDRRRSVLNSSGLLQSGREEFSCPRCKTKIDRRHHERRRPIPGPSDDW